MQKAINPTPNITIEQLVDAMNKSIEQLGGTDKALEAADRMYSATFRTPAFKLGDMENWEELVPQLEIDLVTSMYTAATGSKAPTAPDYNSSEDEIDSYSYEMDAFVDVAEHWFKKQNKAFEISQDTLIVEHLSYKGEGEGITALYHLNKDLPVFTCKADSFLAANC